MNRRMQKQFAGNAARICCRILCAALMLSMAGSVRAQMRISSDRPGGLSPLAREMLRFHNAVRAEVRLPPLQWSSELAASSQRWADTLVARNRSAHNPNSRYGENIFVTGLGSTASMAVKEWASESRDYDYRTNTCSTDCGHYTQIVWRDTAKVGCAVARGARREVWVCSYDPPGNYQNQWPY